MNSPDFSDSPVQVSLLSQESKPNTEKWLMEQYTKPLSHMLLDQVEDEEELNKSKHSYTLLEILTMFLPADILTHTSNDM